MNRSERRAMLCVCNVVKCTTEKVGARQGVASELKTHDLFFIPIMDGKHNLNKERKEIVSENFASGCFLGAFGADECRSANISIRKLLRGYFCFLHATEFSVFMFYKIASSGSSVDEDDEIE